MLSTDNHKITKTTFPDIFPFSDLDDATLQEGYLQISDSKRILFKSSSTLSQHPYLLTLFEKLYPNERDYNLAVSDLQDKTFTPLTLVGEQIQKGSCGTIFRINQVFFNTELPPEFPKTMNPIVVKIPNPNRADAPSMLAQEESLLQNLNPHGTATGIQKPPVLFSSQNLVNLAHKISGALHNIPFQTALAADYYENDLFDSCKLKMLTSAHKKPLICQLLCGLLKLYTEGVLHGDIKPENIFTCLNTPKPLVHLADFGGAITLETAKHLFDKYRFDTNHITNETSRLDAVLRSRGIFTTYYHPETHKIPPPADKVLIRANISKNSGSEYDALLKGDFDAWVTTKKRNDLFALAVTIQASIKHLLTEKDHQLLNTLKTTDAPDETLQQVILAFQ